jgi:hypothetical protein
MMRRGAGSELPAMLRQTHQHTVTPVGFWRCEAMFHLAKLAPALVIALMPALVSGQDRFFDSNGVTIRYVDQGSGEPVVFVHGFSSNIETAWITPGVFSNLAKDHRVIALDLRGRGKSDKPRNALAAVRVQRSQSSAPPMQISRR